MIARPELPENARRSSGPSQPSPTPCTVSTPRDESPSSTPPDLKILGHADKDEPLGCTSHETFHYLRPDGSAFPATECPLLFPRLTGETVHVDLDWFVRKGTTHVAVSYSSAPVDLTDGRGAVVAFRDISDRLRLRELETSHARIVQAADEARRRIERDLHDGAQQQFVAVAMRLETPGACSRSRPMTPRGSSGPRTPTSAKPSQNSSA